MPDLRQINNALTEYIRPQTHPVAIRMCSQDETLPENTRTPSDLGLDISVCHAISYARKHGSTIAVDKNQSCWIAGIGLGLLPLKPGVADGSVQASLGLWGHDKTHAAALVSSMTCLEYGLYDRVLMAPLSKATFTPHVVLMYGTPAQIWLLVTSYLWESGEFKLDASVSIGTGCVNNIAKAMTTGVPQFGIIGVGERYHHAQDHECALSIPMNAMPTILDTFSIIRKTGVLKYPVPAHLKFNSGHPPGYEKMLAHLKAD